MAIKIPSKNIYNIDNPKVRDNLIDNISLNETIISPSNEYETTIYNGKETNIELSQFSNDPEQNDVGIDTQVQIGSLDNGSSINIGYISYCGYQDYYTSPIRIDFPIIINNKYISKIYYGKDDNGEPNIKITALCKKTIGDATADATFIGNKFREIKNILLGEGSIISNDLFAIPNTIENTHSDSMHHTSATVSSSAKLYQSPSLLTATPIIEQNNVSIRFSAVSQVTVVKFSYTAVGVQPSTSSTLQTFNIKGTYEKYIPTQIQVTVYGNTIGIDLTDGSITQGGGDKPFSLSGNELMQDSSKIYVKDTVEIHSVQDDPNSGTITQYFIYFYCNSSPKTIVVDNNEYEVLTNEGLKPDNIYYFKSYSRLFNDGDKPSVTLCFSSANYLAKNILSAYSKGKETATLLCSISDYFDYSNPKNKLISKHGADGLPMTFSLHDIVVPMVYQPNGKDAPMSKKGILAKEFEVVGVKMIYDGAVWQELTLQEK